MKPSFATKLYDREIDSLAVRSKSHRKLYADRRLIDQLDIVNELDGHSGCVNALSWSKSGQLLASGSDDQHLNIYKYQPDNTNAQFQLSSTVATGHSQNIFSVKFMPHHNDRTVITCAGDHQVRIFDLEYAGAARVASNASAMASEGRMRGRANTFSGVRYLNDGDTDCRVYRSHGDRVKRIVTESSPHLFLTCSEDGEVRQWDLRQPSTAYPAPRYGRMDRLNSAVDDSIPPPLISYKRYRIDLNTISCSPAQPHYIVLGGAHLHAFLHDRRMMGRDRLQEEGKHLSSMSTEEEGLMDEATKCVRRFAPRGQKKMSRSENGHITACKISDARPNEMIASWSGDHIYSFGLNGSSETDAEDTLASSRGSQGTRVKESRDRKRKRATNGSESSTATSTKPSLRPRNEEMNADLDRTALRIRYQNGQSEDVPLSGRQLRQERRRRADITTAKEREAQHLAKATVKIRASLFGPPEENQDSAGQFTSALGRAAAMLDDIDERMRNWSYPMNPSAETVILQQTLRRDRESTRRFVQAAGSLARVLGGRLQTPSGMSPVMASFISIDARTNDLPANTQEQFGYDFLRAILLWLESGVGRLIEGFTRPTEMIPTVRAAQRLPIPESEASTESIDEFLIPYLLESASNRSIINVEANRFETDATRNLFASERAVVLAFAAAIRIPFADLSSAVVLTEGTDHIQAQDRETAIRYWGQKVARGVLLNAAENINFSLVSRAFGGSGRVVEGLDAGGPVGDGDDEDAVEQVQLVDGEGSTIDGSGDLGHVLRTIDEGEGHNAIADPAESSVINSTRADRVVQHQQIAADQVDFDNAVEDRELGEEEAIEDMDSDENSDEDLYYQDDDDNTSNDTDDGRDVFLLPNGSLPLHMFANNRRQGKDKVGADVPCTAATRTYKGHCNVKTVKDVNYFGLDDEYVVSGSDDGNLFIWDRKTSALINILDGDGEVVNVVQGHPYETMLAVSGIDHTIKIFSPDARAREIARLGRGVNAHDSSTFSSLAWPAQLGRRRRSRRSETTVESNTPTNQTSSTSEPAVPNSTAIDAEDEDVVAPTGLASRRRMDQEYRITSQNNMERQGGNLDTFITVRDLHPILMMIGRANW